MGDLATDTQVHERGDRFVANLSRDWEVWGPNGGYVASIALRAAGAASRFGRPASFSAHYLGVADFAEVELAVRVLRTAKRAQSLGVSMTQRGQPIMEAMVWTVDELAGLEHDVTIAPDVPAPSALKSMAELNPGQDAPFKFWANFESKPTEWINPWPPATALPPVVREWNRYLPRSTFDDPFVDAARSLLLLDTLQWPAAHRFHAHAAAGFIAPTIDIAVNFHRAAAEQEWLLTVAEAPLAHRGLIAGKAAVWTEDGHMLASGGGHLMCRPVPRGTPGAA